MDVIGLQDKTRPKSGKIEHYWFENENIGLKKTLFHRIVIPFESFDSGLDYVSQPESPELTIEWINLGLEDPSQLDGVEIAMGATPDVEASVYIGHAHNWTEIKRLALRRVADNEYELSCNALVQFETEGVGVNEELEFRTTASFRGEA